MSINSISPLRHDIAQLVAQMHDVARKVELPTHNSIQTSNQVSTVSFSNYLHDALNQVAQTQKTAEDLATSYERGDPGVDLAQMSVAMARAKVEFSAAVAVRNAFTNAYHEIFNMPV